MNNLAFDTSGRKSKAARAAMKRKTNYLSSLTYVTTDDVHPAKEFDSSTVVSPLLDPRILERRVMAAKAGDRTAQ
jgi:hypothetical protein